MKESVAAVLGLLALVGCGPKAEVTRLTSVPPAPLASGFFRNSCEGFTFDLPQTWTAPRPGAAPDVDMLFNVSQPGSIIGVDSSIDTGAKEAVVTLVDSSVRVLPTDAPVMVNVVVKTVKDGANLKLEAASFVARVYDGVRKSTSELALPVGPGVLVTAVRGLKTGDKFYFADLLLVDGEKVFQFRFVGNEAKMIRQIAEICASSFRIDPNAKPNVQQPQSDTVMKEALSQFGESMDSSPPPDPGMEQ